MPKRALIISYDIQSNRRRRRVFRCLERWGLAAQYSVFECRLTRAQAEELFLQLEALIDEKNDRLLLAWIDNRRKPIAGTAATEISFRQALDYLG